MVGMLAEVAAAASDIDKAVSWTDFGIRSDPANPMLSFKDRQIALRSNLQALCHHASRKKTGFSEQNTSKTLKNRRLWMGTRLGEFMRPSPSRP
ncbi:hypothetical protein [Sinorhizobium meliloti]|uniref:hypothetical protein n=1 Tax=Rhizobium meliloti TaxID=382 RepID=UPI00398D171D